MEFPRLVMRRFALGAPYPWLGFASPFVDQDLHVGADFLAQFSDRVGAALQREKKDAGLISSLMDLECEGFDPGKLDPIIHDFYARTSAYALKVAIEWNPFIRPFGWLYHQLIAQEVEQLDVPPVDTRRMRAVESHVELIDVDQDGTTDLRCWVRVMKDNKAVFYVGAFHTYKSKVGGRENAYLACAFPLPRFNLAVALKMQNLSGGGLLLTSDANDATEAGSYLIVPHDSSFSMIPALGLSERFHFLPIKGESGRCKVIHEEYWLGVKAFRLRYDVRLKESHHKKVFAHLRAPSAGASQGT